ncbi:hypothetical protein Rhal01_00933 [Rubritalea halochordaticola]|uniref:Alpha/beta hydrolase n=2 Tax=Rubritalea halochordaticola TaxID=714537 RepID=A0ABP9UYK1_9BACT
MEGRALRFKWKQAGIFLWLLFTGDMKWMDSVKCVLLGLCVLANSCAPVRLQQYRTDHDVQEVSRISDAPRKEFAKKSQFVRKPQQQGSLYFGVVEYDDKGFLHDRAQADAVLERIRKVHHDMRRNGDQRNHLIVLYVHGWQHNAKYENGNLRSYAETMEKWVADHIAKGQHVTAIYVAWRGKSSVSPLGTEYLTSFWNRKSASVNVGIGQLPEFLSRVEYLADRYNRSTSKVQGNGSATVLPNKKQGVRLVSIGHSFGASVLLNAIYPVTMRRLSEALEKDRGLVKAYGDLVVLINPAVEANRLAPLRMLSDLYGREKGYLGGRSPQPPNIVILSAKNDWPNFLAFPAGRWIGEFNIASSNLTMKRGLKDAPYYDQLKMDRITAGRYPPFATHRLSNPEALPGKLVKFGEPNWIKAQPGWSHRFTTSSRMTLTHLGNEHVPAYDPIWLVKVDDYRIINGHNDFWSGNLSAFVGDVLTYRVGGSKKGSFIAPTITDTRKVPLFLDPFRILFPRPEKQRER